MSVALSAVVRTGEQRSPATLLAGLTAAAEQLEECSGVWRRFTVHGPSHQVRPQPRRDRGELGGPELRALLPRLDGDDVRIAASTGLVCWRFPGEPQPERMPMSLRVAARGRALTGWGDERGEGLAELVLDPVWPFRTPGGRVGPAEAARYADNRDLLVRLVEAVVEVCAPESVRLHTDAGPPLPFDAHLLYYRDPGAALADLRWVAELWERGDPTRWTPPLRGVPEPELPRVLHPWRPRSTLGAVRAGLGRAVAVLEDVGPEQVEGVLTAGSCPVRRLGEGFLVLGGEAFVDGFVDPFFSELADLVEPPG